MAELIVMLTCDDVTVADAPAVFAKCKGSKARYWGMKEEGLPPEQMKTLYAEMKRCGITTFLEVVAYSEEEGLKGAELAAECGVDFLMGTMYSDVINEVCRSHGIGYLPFVGTVEQRPSVLRGAPEMMVSEARKAAESGAYGVDLLGYRYEGDAPALNRRVVKESGVPVCVAGSIDSEKRLREVRDLDPWTFTIGSAFFHNCFGDDMRRQIDFVCDFMHADA